MTEDLQERVEANPLGHAVITAVIFFILAVFLGSNLPVSSPIKDSIVRLVRPVRNTVGLDQYWGVFAPNPRNETWGIRARITYSDGTAGNWSTPNGDAFIGEYRFYRWNKYAEQIFQRDRHGLWPGFALWLVRTLDRPDRHPIQVELIRRSYKLNPPGSKVTHGPWEETTFYVLPVTPQVLREATR